MVSFPSGMSTPTLAKGAAPPPGPSRWRGHIKPLDGLRGIAILLVMWFHFAWPAKAQGLITRLYVSVAALGWVGVDLFFVLSGFLITGILLDSKRGAGYFRNFYARRVLRIFPLYYAVLLVTLVILPLIVPYDTPALKRLLEGQGWLWLYSTNISVAVEHGNWIASADWLRMGALWSLAVEEHFYLVWPLLVFFLSRRALLRTSIAMIVLVPILRTVALFAGVVSDTINLIPGKRRMCTPARSRCWPRDDRRALRRSSGSRMPRKVRAAPCAIRRSRPSARTFLSME